MTLEFSIRFKKPIPLDMELRAVSRLTVENKRFFEGTGEIILPDGKVAATAEGKYIKMPVDKISSAFTLEPDDWITVKSENDPDIIEI